MGKFSVESDPRGLIFEAYRIDGITNEDCRSIFFDWALNLKSDVDAVAEVLILYNIYGKENPDHPMTEVLKEGLSNFSGKTKRRLRPR